MQAQINKIMQSQSLKRLESNIQYLGFPNLINFAANQAKMFTLGKIEEYRAIVKYFESKYKMTYRKYDSQIKKMINNEDFEKEDDLMEWRFAEEAIILYEKELKAIEKC